MKQNLHNSLRAQVLSLVVLLSLPILAEQVEIGGINYDLDAETNQASVVPLSEDVVYTGNIVIPATVVHEGEVYAVKSIGAMAFYWCSNLTSITIPNSVNSIGEYAFYSCAGLTSVTIPNSVTTIGNSAFRYCFGLTSIIIPNSVTSIGNYAFVDCVGLISINVEDGNPVYDSRNDCNAVIETATNALIKGCSSTIIPNSVTSIGESAFQRCQNMASVAIPNSVTSIGNNAFYNCPGLTSVTISNCVTSIGDWTFWYCEDLTSVTIGNSVTDIGEGTFMGCNGLTSVTIPNSVTSIGESAFSYCIGLISVTIGTGVENISYTAFANCPELIDVYCLAENVPSAEYSVFYDSFIENATLHVPVISVYAYKTTEPWSGFGNVVALTEEETGITEAESENKETENSVVYDLSGHLVHNPQKGGVYIVNRKKVVN